MKKHLNVSKISLLMFLVFITSCKQEPLAPDPSINTKGAKVTYATTLNLTSLWDESRFLSNPDKGWFHHYFDDGNTRYLTKTDADITNFPGMHHLYLRMPWSSLEPTEGSYNWALIDNLVNKWWPKGYKFGITLTCSETAIHYATPQWVKNAGAKGAFYTVSWAPNNPFWEPAFDDAIFLQKLENFYAAFAARYKGQGWLQYMDMGSYGNWGEGHTS